MTKANIRKKQHRNKVFYQNIFLYCTYNGNANRVDDRKSLLFVMLIMPEGSSFH